MVFLLVFFILMAILAYPIAYWPHYEKTVYKKQEPLTWESMEEIHQNNVERYGAEWTTRFTGFPTEGMHTELTSGDAFQYEENIDEDASSIFEEMSKALDALETLGEDIPNEVYCLEVDVEDLEPTGVYECVYEFKTTPGGGGGLRRSVPANTNNVEPYTTSYVKTVLNRSKAIYAQYYVLTLDDGNKILVLLNDTMIEIPKTGRIQLPLAEKVGLLLDEIDEIKNELLEKYNLNYSKSLNTTKILDASTGWLFLNEDIEKAHDGRIMLFLLLFCVGIVGTFLMFFGSIILIKKVK